ncbi:MAG: hypothetical protein HY435_01170 [Candidatus Liptonbacteria bacterium]|nr:hypothetical protein [Candidatus Liptonbacteria bacterium]
MYVRIRKVSEGRLRLEEAINGALQELKEGEGRAAVAVQVIRTHHESTPPVHDVMFVFDERSR